MSRCLTAISLILFVTNLGVANAQVQMGTGAGVGPCFGVACGAGTPPNVGTGASGGPCFGAACGAIDSPNRSFDYQSTDSPNRPSDYQSQSPYGGPYSGPTYGR
jgi:hypothetical protein